MLTAFSTASSVATLPITYTSVRDDVGVRERSAGLGVLVGTHFNRDGTALYEAITPIFIAQALERPLDLTQQLMVLVMAVIASIAAPGVPQAGLVTMVLVFQAVDLPIGFIALLLPLDWLLDRFRTAVNVLGGMTMTCLLDRRSIPYAQRRPRSRSGARNRQLMDRLHSFSVVFHSRLFAFIRVHSRLSSY